MGAGRNGAGLRILILGGAGMLGHKLAQEFRNRFETWVTLRGSAGAYSEHSLFDLARIIPHTDISSFDAVVRAMKTARPDAVINCIGVIKQLPTAKDPLLSIETNALFPHRLANLCAAAAVRVIHISTDCVFSGAKGQYTESDVADAHDLYGRTKYLGEISGDQMLTLRTSIVGRELRTSSGLVEWFLSQRRGRVRGWTRAVYTGLTTLVLARVIGDILERYAPLNGVYQVASDPITKYELLCLLGDAYGAEVEIERSDEVAIDRSLDGSRFRAATGFVAPSWLDMVGEMAADPTPYDEWRHGHAS
ncbi:MAG TPA: SDR family oxidoreductase [Thermoanaerobaculia bacterium]|nr:SDR family oxidoreductase [Thermoanaerobaculia bacterium]